MKSRALISSWRAVSLPDFGEYAEAAGPAQGVKLPVEVLIHFGDPRIPDEGTREHGRLGLQTERGGGRRHRGADFRHRFLYRL